MFDHGILNLPLSKRGGGSIDAQIDRYKREKAREDRARDRANAAKTKALRDQAKTLIASDRAAAIVERMSAATGLTVAAVRRNMAQQARWNPSLVIRVFAEDAARA